MARQAMVVLAHVPDTATAEEIAQRVAQEYSDETQDNIIWFIDIELPDSMNVGLADQLNAYRRDAGPDCCFMTIIMCNEEEANEYYGE